MPALVLNYGITVKAIAPLHIFPCYHVTESRDLKMTLES